MSGSKNQKFGRSKRAPTHAQQITRTAKNKRLRIEREAKRLATPKTMRVARGTARWNRRHTGNRPVRLAEAA